MGAKLCLSCVAGIAPDEEPTLHYPAPDEELPSLGLEPETNYEGPCIRFTDCPPPERKNSERSLVPHAPLDNLHDLEATEHTHMRPRQQEDGTGDSMAWRFNGWHSGDTLKVLDVQASSEPTQEVSRSSIDSMACRFNGWHSGDTLKVPNVQASSEPTKEVSRSSIESMACRFNGWHSGDTLKVPDGQASSEPTKEVSRSSIDSASTSPPYIDPFHGLRREQSAMQVAGAVSEVYVVQDSLGVGTFGVVTKVRHKKTSKLYAVKTVDVGSFTNREAFMKEVCIARKFNHPHVVKLHEYFEEASSIHLVMELCTGGDLVEKLNETKRLAGRVSGLGFTAPVIARYAWQMFNGIAYMHHYKFVHRDVKPDNFMLLNSTMTAPLKLVDFGYARSLAKGQKMYSRVGSESFMAPEVKASPCSGYDMRCDVWSLGITIYCLAVGTLPKWSKGPKDIDELQVPDMFFAQFPTELMDLLNMLLERDPKRRVHAKEALKTCEWFQKHGRGNRATSCCGFL